jgi:hypothetical protein
MSPVAADRLTCTTSVEVKMAYQTNASELWMDSSAVRLKTHLVGKHERKFYFVRYLGITTTTQDE